MSTVFLENFGGGTPGGAVTAANTAFSSVDPGFTFTTSPAPPEGSFAATLSVAANATATANKSFGATKNLIYRRCYLYLPSYPAAVSAFHTARSTGNVVATLRLTSTGTVQVRDGSTTVYTSSAIPLNTWVRLTWRIDKTNGQQQIRLFIGANVGGTTPDVDSGSVAFTGAAPDELRLGFSNGSTVSGYSLTFDAVADDDATWPGPVPLTTAALLARSTVVNPEASFTDKWADAAPAADTTYDLRTSAFSGYFFADAIFGYASFSDGAGGTTATSHQLNDVPIEIGGTAPPARSAVIGGKATGDQDRNLSWEDMKHGSPVEDAITAGMDPTTAYATYIPGNNNMDGDGLRIHVAQGSWAIVDGFRADSTMDGIGVYSATDSLSDTGTVYVRNSWIRFNHDDAIENDRAYLTLFVDDCLFEQVHAFLSYRASDTSGSPDVSKTATVTNSVIYQYPKPGPSQQPRTATGSGNFFKNQANSPPLVMNNVIMAVEKPAAPGQMTLPTYAGCSYTNVTIVWLGTGAYPGNVPAGCTLTTDATVLTNAIADWKARHGIASFDTVDMSKMIAPLTSAPVPADALMLGGGSVSLRVGTTAVTAAYLGDTQVWPGTVVPTSLVDNGDGTFTATGSAVVDNGDGTFTLPAADNGDGTYTITV